MRRCPRAWCPDLHVHSMHPGVHVVQPRCPRRPCRPRPHHCACCTFSDMEHGAHGTHCRTVSMRTIVARCSRQDKSEKLRRQCPCREALALGVRVRPTGLMEPRPQGLRPWQPLPHRAHAHHPFIVASISGEKRIVHAKTSAPPQRSVRAGTVGGIRPRQVPWMIAARSCSRRLLHCQRVKRIRANLAHFPALQLLYCLAKI